MSMCVFSLVLQCNVILFIDACLDIYVTKLTCDLSIWGAACLLSSLPVCLSVCQSIHLSVRPSVHSPGRPAIWLPVCMAGYGFLCLCIGMSFIHPPISVLVSLCVCVSQCLCQSVSLSVCVSVSLCLCQSVSCVSLSVHVLQVSCLCPQSCQWCSNCLHGKCISVADKCDVVNQCQRQQRVIKELGSCVERLCQASDCDKCKVQKQKNPCIWTRQFKRSSKSNRHVVSLCQCQCRDCVSGISH